MTNPRQRLLRRIDVEARTAPFALIDLPKNARGNVPAANQDQ